MTAAISPLNTLSGLISPARSTATSEPARRLGGILDQIREHLLASYVLRNATEKVLDELDEVFAEASTEGWNGYGGLPLNPAARDFAKSFLYALPTTAPLPEVSADPDGEVSLDWHFGHRKTLSVSIGATGRCTFAWMQGVSSNRGTEWMEASIPASIVFALSKLAGDTAGSRTR